MSIFRTFRSTVTPFLRRQWPNNLGLLVDPITGAPCGIESPNANGADGVWTPTDLTAAQIASPSAAMLADLNATYRLNVAPYTRYQSTGTMLVTLGATDVLPFGQDGTDVIWAPWTISAANSPVYVVGPVYVRTLPA
jgi:hypothetical protein